MAIHEVRMPGRILYGRGSFAEVGRIAASLGKNVLIVSDPIMDRMGNVAACEQYLSEQGIPCAKYVGVDSEPTDRHVDEALTMCRELGCDTLVAVGGGSCLDTAKAAAVLMTNGGHIRDYVGSHKPFANKPLPLIAVPTTAGTGSEVTKVTVIIDTEQDVKMMLARPELLPAVAIVDPILTLSCPPSVTAATGVDALCHAMEAFISRRAQPVTDAWALQAIELIMKNLRLAYEQGDNLEAREQMALASMLAGAAFSNASVTLVHGMSRPIGAMFHVPHGVSNAMLLPAVLEFTKESALERLAIIGRIIASDGTGRSEAETVDKLILEIKRLCRDLQIPNVKTWGIDKTRWNQVVSKMAADALASGSPGNHPRIPTHDELVQLYHVCYDYDFSVHTESMG